MSIYDAKLTGAEHIETKRIEAGIHLGWGRVVIVVTALICTAWVLVEGVA